MYLLTNSDSDDDTEYGASRHEGGTTGITTLKDADVATSIYFDLNGRRLKGKPTQKGVYICNGKKMVML